MADISDVESALTSVVTSILYPNGSAEASLPGPLCRIYRGWPAPATLNADLAAGVANITVNSDNDPGRTTTRYLPQWQAGSSVPGTVAAVSGQTITISGTPAVGDVVGAIVDGVPYSYRALAGDGPGLIAANLAQAIQATRMASYQGFTVTIPDARSVTAQAVCDNTARVESRRQEKDIRIACWCAAPSVRDIVAAAIDSELSGLAFLPLADGTQARLTYRNTQSYDQSQNALLYRRDIVYTVEYATIETDMLPSMLFGVSNIGDDTTYV